MDLFTIIIGVIALLVAGGLVFLMYSGFFYTYTIRCTVPASIPTSYAYLVHTGPYDKVGSVFGKLNQICPKRVLFGVYYDDPKKVPSAQLRSIVGAEITKASQKEREAFEKNGCSFGSFPECRRALVTEFPFRTYFSIWIAVRRVYPALMDYIKEHNIKNFGPCMEIYKDDAIQFVIALDNIEGFHVPEIPMDEEPPVVEEGSKKTN